MLVDSAGNAGGGNVEGGPLVPGDDWLFDGFEDLSHPVRRPAPLGAQAPPSTTSFPPLAPPEVFAKGKQARLREMTDADDRS